MKTKKIEQRLTKMETEYTHIENTLEKLVDKVDSLQNKIYIAMGGFMIVQFLITSGIIKLGV